MAKLGKPSLLLLASVVGVFLGTVACEPESSSIAKKATSSVPVVYFQRSPIKAWQAIDWEGAAHGAVGSDHVGMPYQSPDGSRLVWSPEGEWQVVGRNGAVLRTVDLSRSRGVAWADDSSGLCVLNESNQTQPGGHKYQLEFESAMIGSRTIASLTTALGANVAACSPPAGRVVVITASGYKDPVTQLRRIAFGEIIMIDFKTGTVQPPQSLTAGGGGPFSVNAAAVSHDGSYAAFATSSEMTIVNLISGQTLKQSNHVTPLVFSWDSRELAVTTTSNRGGIVVVSSGQYVWMDSIPNRITQGAAADPAGSRLMLFTNTGRSDDLLVVSTNGSSHTIAQGVFADQVAPCLNCSAF